MHISQKKKQKPKKILLYSNPYILTYYYYEPISSPPPRPMNYLQLGFNQLTKTTSGRWQINLLKL